MLSLISLALGFISPFLGPVIGQAMDYFKAKQQDAHELAMMQESNKAAREIAQLNAQVTLAQADVDDTRSARSTQVSYGTQLLDAIKDGGWVEKNLVAPVLILALTVIEIINGLMRPWVVYLVSGMWASAKFAQFYFGYEAALGGGTSKQEVIYALAAAAAAAWNSEDNLYMEYVVGYLLGSSHQLKFNSAK